MTGDFPSPPTLSADQVISAGAHLNALRLSSLYLLGLYQAAQPAWIRGKGPFWIRQKTDTLLYQVYVKQAPFGGGELEIWYDDTRLVNADTGTGSGWQLVTGSVSIDAFTPGAFHRIRVRNFDHDGDGDEREQEFVVYYLREAAPATIPTLFAFATGTPTAGEWQDLSTAATALNENMQMPIPLVPAQFVGRPGSVAATCVHRSNTLYYHVRYVPALHGHASGTVGNPPGTISDADPGEGKDNWEGFRAWTVWLNLYIDLGLGAGAVKVATVGGQVTLAVTNGISASETTITLHDASGVIAGSVLRSQSAELILLGTKTGQVFTGCTRGYQGTTPKPVGDRAELEVYFDGAYDVARTLWPWEYKGTVDLRPYGIADGADYKLEFRVEDSNAGDTDEDRCLAWVVSMGEQPDDYGVPTWWTKLDPWKHGDYVNGTGGVKVIRDNLTALSTHAHNYNWACAVGPSGAQVHRSPWLHYRCDVTGDDKKAPSFFYWAFGKREETSLKFEPNKWLVYNLDAASGLFAGTLYELHDVTAAFEDVVE